jgi:hypothetical protein
VARRAKAKRDRLAILDRAALVLAIKIAREHSPADRQRIDRKLAEEPWVEVAMDAAHSCQEWALRLDPWQCWPPCAVEPGSVDTPGLEHRGISSSAKLLRQMLALDISRWHPDPLAAIEAAEAESARRTAVAAASSSLEEGLNAKPVADRDTVTS